MRAGGVFFDTPPLGDPPGGTPLGDPLETPWEGLKDLLSGVKIVPSITDRGGFLTCFWIRRVQKQTFLVPKMREAAIKVYYR